LPPSRPGTGALNYWFWEFHVEDLAILVDVILRRRTGSAEVRVTLWRGRADSTLSGLR
jgi:hypothetical protein